MKNDEPWYLLFFETSPDGRGTPTYLTRTTIKKVAKKFWDEEKSEPYNTSQVIVVTDRIYKQIIFDSDWEDYE